MERGGGEHGSSAVGRLAFPVAVTGGLEREALLERELSVFEEQGSQQACGF